jgi:hypothetical protein
VTAVPFKAISQTTSAHVFNVPVPSLETIISREVLWTSKVTLKITNTNKDPNYFAVNYGVTDALAPFPLHSLVSTMTATINNNTVSLNIADTLPTLLRMMDPEELANYDDMTPTCLDYLADYRDGVEQLDYFIGRNPTTNAIIPFYPGNAFAIAGDGESGTGPVQFESYPNNVLAYDMNRPAGCVSTHRPRGHFKINSIYAYDAANKRVPTQADTEIYVEFQVTEPLLLSPFIFGSGLGKQGFYGIQTMNFQMNMLSHGNRAWRAAKVGQANWAKNVTVHEFSESTLLFQFLTPHASEMLEARNVVPYYEFPVYRSTNYDTINGRAVNTLAGNVVAFTEGQSATLPSSNIQLNGIPDKLLIFVRKTMGNLTCHDADSYLTIKSLRVNFNNQAGLLASQSQQQLYKNCKLSGMHLTWDQFSGTTVSLAGRAAGSSEPRGSYGGIGSTYTNSPTVAGVPSPGFKLISTTGSILALNFAEVIQLTDEYYAPGSLGTFNLQVSLEVVNNTLTNWPANSYEMVIIPMNCGVFVNERGTSSTFLSLLTKQDVLDSLTQTPYTNHEIHRLVGGNSFLDKVRSGLSWIHSKLPAVKGVLGHIPHPMAQTAHNVLGAMGYGKHAALEDRLMKK